MAGKGPFKEIAFLYPERLEEILKSLEEVKITEDELRASTRATIKDLPSIDIFDEEWADLFVDEEIESESRMALTTEMVDKKSPSKTKLIDYIIAKAGYHEDEEKAGIEYREQFERIIQEKPAQTEKKIAESTEKEPVKPSYETDGIFEIFFKEVNKNIKDIEIQLAKEKAEKEVLEIETLKKGSDFIEKVTSSLDETQKAIVEKTAKYKSSMEMKAKASPENTKAKIISKARELALHSLRNHFSSLGNYYADSSKYYFPETDLTRALSSQYLSALYNVPEMTEQMLQAQEEKKNGQLEGMKEELAKLIPTAYHHNIEDLSKVNEDFDLFLASPSILGPVRKEKTSVTKDKIIGEQALKTKEILTKSIKQANQLTRAGLLEDLHKIYQHGLADAYSKKLPQNRTWQSVLLRPIAKENQKEQIINQIGHEEERLSNKEQQIQQKLEMLVSERQNELSQIPYQTLTDRQWTADELASQFSKLSLTTEITPEQYIKKYLQDEDVKRLLEKYKFNTNDLSSKNPVEKVYLIKKFMLEALGKENEDKTLKKNIADKLKNLKSKQLQAQEKYLNGLTLENVENSLKNELAEAIKYEIASVSDFCLRSKLKDNNPENAKFGKIYLSVDGSYVVRDLQGLVHQGTLPKELLTFMENLEKNLNSPDFKRAVLEATSKIGHTPSDNIQQELNEKYKDQLEQADAIENDDERRTERQKVVKKIKGEKNKIINDIVNERIKEPLNHMMAPIIAACENAYLADPDCIVAREELQALEAKTSQGIKFKLLSFKNEFMNTFYPQVVLAANGLKRTYQEFTNAQKEHQLFDKKGGSPSCLSFIPVKITGDKPEQDRYECLVAMSGSVLDMTGIPASSSTKPHVIAHDILKNFTDAMPLVPIKISDAGNIITLEEKEIELKDGEKLATMKFRYVDDAAKALNLVLQQIGKGLSGSAKALSPLKNDVLPSFEKACAEKRLVSELVTLFKKHGNKIQVLGCDNIALPIKAEAIKEEVSRPTTPAAPADTKKTTRGKKTEVTTTTTPATVETATTTAAPTSTVDTVATTTTATAPTPVPDSATTTAATAKSSVKKKPTGEFSIVGQRYKDAPTDKTKVKVSLSGSHIACCESCQGNKPAVFTLAYDAQRQSQKNKNAAAYVCEPVASLALAAGTKSTKKHF